LLNQLNAAVNQCDQLKREKEDMVTQMNKLKEDYRRLRDDVKEKEILYGKAKD
jgi:septation ring formation regulator EzrA